MTALSQSDQQLWKKVLAAKNSCMTQVQIEQSMPGMHRRDVAFSIQALLKIQLLTSEKSRDGQGNIIFRGQQPKDAKKKQALTPEQSLILGIISKAGNRGISAKLIRAHIGAETMPQTLLRKSLDALEREGHIKSFKGIQQPTISLYILPHIKAAEELTGGVWYDNQKEYDAEFVNGITSFLLDKVKSMTFPVKEHRRPEHVELVADAIYPILRTSKLPTPHYLLKQLKRSGLISVELKVKNVMECMRALELDGLVDAIKPVGGVNVPDIVASSDDDEDGPSGRRKRKIDADGAEDIDEAELERQLDLEKEKAKERAKDVKRRERKRAKKKAKEREHRKRAKEKERKRARRKERREEGVGEGSSKRKKNVELSPEPYASDDSDRLLPLEEALAENHVNGTSSKRDTSTASKRKRRVVSSEESESESSGSRSSDSDHASDVDSDDTVSSVGSADIDTRDITLKPRTTAAQTQGELQAAAFARTGLGALDDYHIVYRATALANLLSGQISRPLGQTQIPCGKCPQFNLCQEGGPVDADSCAYLDDWLADIRSGWDREGRQRYHGMPDDGVVHEADGGETDEDGNQQTEED